MEKVVQTFNMKGFGVGCIVVWVLLIPPAPSLLSTDLIIMLFQDDVDQCF